MLYNQASHVDSMCAQYQQLPLKKMEVFQMKVSKQIAGVSKSIKTSTKLPGLWHNSQHEQKVQGHNHHYQQNVKQCPHKWHDMRQSSTHSPARFLEMLNHGQLLFNGGRKPANSKSDDPPACVWCWTGGMHCDVFCQLAELLLCTSKIKEVARGGPAGGYL